MPFLLLDVEAPPTNRALAMEKALTRPQSQRRAAKPVLRGKHWTCHLSHAAFLLTALCIPIS